jgi:hypothetical protein
VNGHIIGFSDKGYEVIHASVGLDANLRTDAYPEGTWALVDVDFKEPGNTQGTPESALKGRNLFTVFTTSIEADRYDEFCKECNAEFLVMNPFSWDEYYFSA